ncbi:trichohyalin-like isoform X3 [Argopecten irradians]|uniref:trichohyalin-like isoform X1 n=1 Tax=Argopecten irradians TaxID=31199 RepID=UPI00370FD789
MSTNLSLMNPGTSLNFDGQVLQNAQEEEYRQEEEQQHNELKQLLTNAFDDLIDDDEFSITSDEGGPSTNASLHLGTKTESPGDGVESTEAGNFLDSRNQWTPYQGMPASAPVIPPQSLATIYEASSVRSSQENPLRSSQEMSVRGSQDLLRSSQEDFSLRNSRDHPLRSSQEYTREQALRSSQDYSNRDQGLRSSQEYRGEALRGSQDYQQGYQEYLPAGTGEEFQSDGYHSNNSEQESAAPNYNINPQAFDWINQATQDSHAVQGRQGGYGGYQGGVMDDNGSTRYPELPVRQETEGGNNNGVPGDHQTYLHNQPHGVYGSDTYSEDQPRGGAFQPYSSLPHSQGYQSAEIPPHSQGYQTGGATQDFYSQSAVSDDRNYHSTDPYVTRDDGQGHDLYGSYDQNRGSGKLHGSKEYQEDYRVQYQRRRGPSGERTEEEDRSPRREKPKAPEEKSEETGGLDPRQYSQLQVLYKARGRKLEEITNEYEILKQETGREIRILKHQVSVAKGEQEAASTSLKQVQDLLRESKGDNSHLLGRNKAIETEIEVIKKSKDEVLKKLHVAEANIESLNQQLLDLGNSESLARARHDHEVVIAGIQRKHQQEVKVTNEKIQELNMRITDLSAENKTLRKKLEESYQSAEKAQISRAETINRLTRSLEDSQKQCQTLLETTSSHELSQLKIQLQQTIASRQIADDMCHTYQEEIQDLKEQLSMFESASGLGVLTSGQTSSDGRRPMHDDSILDLGIKKTLDFDTPDSAPSTGAKSRFDGSASDDMVTGLKAELERCLLSNKQKRQQVAQIQEELRSAKKEIGELKQRCERAELTSSDYKKRVDEWEELTRSGDRKSAIEGRLKKDIDNLQREKTILMEDVEDLKKRLEEVGSSEEKLTEMNTELNKQISQMVQDYDNDKREALDRCQRTLESVHEVAKSQLRQEMEAKFAEDQARLVNKYEEDCTNLRNDLDSTLRELDEVKEMYVNVCAQKDNLEQEVRMQTEADTARKLEQIKSELEKEKKEEMERVKEEGSEREASIKEQLKKESDEEIRRAVETKIALAKVAWFEEQRSAKQTAVEKAVKLTETEWKIKLENSVQSEVDSRLQQAKEEWTAQRRLSFESELKKQLQAERETIESKLAAEYSQRLETERAKWLEENQSEMRRSLEREKSRAKTKTELDVETAVKKESDKWKKKMDEEVKKKVEEDLIERVEEEMVKKVEELKKTADKEVEERVENGIKSKLDEVKVKVEEEVKVKLEEEFKVKLDEEFKVRLEEEIKAKLEVARKDWEENNEVETLKKIHNEKEKWNRRKSNEMQERLEEERQSLQGEQEKQLKERLEKERVKWESTYQERVSKEKIKWVAEQDQTNKQVLEQAKQAWEDSHELCVGKIQESMEEQIQERISAEVSLALEEAKTDWSREKDLELSANITSSELSNSVLKEEMEVLKTQISRLQQETKQKEDVWQTERTELTRLKDMERKRALEEIQDQCEKDYKKFTSEHHDTLTQALRAAREQHTREKTDLERRYVEEIESLKLKESRLQEQVHGLGLEEPTHQRVMDKERDMFEQEKWRLQQEVEERDALLEKADYHLSQEVDKLRSELESAYQRRLEAETASLKQKFELESNRPEREKVTDKISVLETENKKLKDENNKIRKENQGLVVEVETIKSENQKTLVALHALKTDKEIGMEENKSVKVEVQKVKAQMFEETKRYVKEVQELKVKIAEQSKVVKEYQAKAEELASAKVVCSTLETRNESLMTEKQSLMAEREKLLSELDSVKSENEDLSKLKFEIEKLHIEAEVFTKLRAEVERLETENEQIGHLRANVEKLEGENAGMNKLRAKVARLEAETDNMSQLKVEVARLQAENSNITALKAEMDRLQSEVEEAGKLRSEVQRLEKENQNLSDLEAEIDRLTSEVENVGKLRSEVERLQAEMSRHQEKVTKVEGEKSRLVENIRDMESAYRRDMVSQKQRQEDTNNRLRQAEKHLVDAKQHYRSQIDKLKKSLETENNMAMETMKGKMVEMQKAHLVALDTMKKQFRAEMEGMRDKVKDERQQKDLSSIEVQTDSEDDEQGVMELREQYLDTVNKIKDDVMRHITETNMRAAETVRCEMAQERNTTLTELKRIYMENVRKILQNEIMGANIEAKLADIEQALDVISFDKPMSRSVSPGSSRSSTPIPTRDIEGSQGSGVMNGLYGNGGSDKRMSRNIQTDRYNGYSSTAPTKDVYGSERGEGRNNRATTERSEHLPHNGRSSQRPQSGRSTDHHGNGSMLPPKIRVPRSQAKEVKFSRSVEERHSRTKSLPGSRLNSKDKLVSFRTISPISSSDNSDAETFITTRRRHKDHSDHQKNELPSRFLTPSNEPRLSSQSNSSFVAVDPRPQNASLQSVSLYKTVSEPELGTDQPRTDYRFSNYKYTSLRDGLAKYRSPSPTKDSTSASHDDLRVYNDPEPDVLDRKAYSIDVGLDTLGLDRTSPRKFNPSPERLSSSSSRDAGESPVNTPRRGQRVTEKRSQSSGPRSREVTKSAPWDIEKRYYSYRYQQPVKHLVEKYQGLSTND